MIADIGYFEKFNNEHFYIERTSDGAYAVRRDDCERASALEKTQEDAIVRAGRSITPQRFMSSASRTRLNAVAQGLSLPGAHRAPTGITRTTACA